MGQPEIKKISKISTPAAGHPFTPGKRNAVRRPSVESASEQASPALNVSGISCGCGSCDDEPQTSEPSPVKVEAISCGCSTCGETETAPSDTEQNFISAANQKLLVAGLFAVAAEAISWFGFSEWLAALFALIAVGFSGATTYKKGWQSLRRFDPNMHALMSIAVTGACLLGQWPEAAMVMVLFNIAEYLEGKSLARARNAIRELMSLTPGQALVQQADGTWHARDTHTVKIDEIVRVKPGVRIPLDGIVIRGSSSIDQAPITGESLPVEKKEGDVVYAGTINQQGSFDYRVTTTTQHTLLARIIQSVEQAQGKRAPIQRLVDRFARIYTPIILGIAILVACIPPLFFAAPWFPWIYKALVLLVIGCPCALVLSTPVAIVTALSVAARNGILIKGGHYLELGRRLEVLALDKTGTLTRGKPELTDVIPLADEHRDNCLHLAAALAAHSDHPVSQAIAKGAASATDFHVENITALSGSGIQGMVNEHHLRIINPKALAATIGQPLAFSEQITQLEQQGKTVVVLVKNELPLALFAVADTLKTSSQQAVEELHRLRIQTVMLTGDNAYTAAQIASQAHIDQVFSNQLPEDKLKHIAQLSQQKTVGMVGDGINDAPALARAHIGFAMGGMGSDTAIETADIALMDDDLRKIPLFVRLSLATWRNMLQNITAALGIKMLFLIATLLGLGTLWMAVFADVGTSLLVVANAMRLLRFK
ncbi:heavy metal translocating P-type ATPase [Tolumonas lignilytica]|uniref:heavy metal translocating P-type ATPase n=1 Tax=Tolumonas lignilytica TaxID=1283284 RepID=UPI00046431B7|nr:heavy metal translocating P-type ATPase [Tolumonas lignilytica]